MSDVLMPRLSDSMEEGTIVRWLKADGQQVARGEELVEIETDKATMTYEADDAGALAILAAEGATVAVGATIATVGDGARADRPGEPAAAAPARAASEPAVAAPAPAPAPAKAEPAAAPAPRGDRISVSPVARRTAQRLGVELAGVQGSGPHGRILKADVTAAAAAGNGGAAAAEPATAEPVAAPAPPSPARDGAGKGEVAVEPLTRLQQTVARRMAESKATVPDFVLEADVDMSAVLDLRAQLKQAVDPAPSINDMLLKLVAATLRRHPRVNGAYRDGQFETYGRVNVGMAVATDDGLVVPTVFDADERSLGALARETRRLAARVRDGSITPPELSGGTFTVSNLGMFGVDRFAGIVNPPQAAILCVGAVAQRAVVAADGGVVARPLATLTLVSDHRILYGADAARFLADLRAALEAPLGVLV